MENCSVEGCDSPAHAREMCQPHYRQYRRRARPGGLKRPGPAPDPVKPFSKYRPPKIREKKTECKYGHEFTEENTYVDPTGARQCRTCRAARAEESRIKHGGIKNPGVGYGGVNRAKTHCKRGHLLAGDNLLPSAVEKGKRTCRLCVNLRRTRLYGITEEQYLQMLVDQNQRCSICKTEFDGNRSPHIDHDHSCCPEEKTSCGKCVRGILCFQCNAGLGKFNDDPALLEAAIVYLGLTTRGDQLTLVVSP